MLIVSKKIWPDTSCPLINLGRACHSEPGPSFERSDAAKRVGWVTGYIVDLVKQYSSGTERMSPEGRERRHSPPDANVPRSMMAGPKNHAVKTIHAPVSAIHFPTLSLVRTERGLVTHSNRNVPEVQAQANLMK